MAARRPGPQGRFQTWSELSTVFHEGVPGHHLQVGAAKTAGDPLSRFAKTNFVSGHGEGWALYSERLADELGWFTEPGTRLGMLGGSALRAARVVIDIGVHLDLPLPDGSRWTFERACELLGTRGRGEPHRIHAEVVRYFGWPGQAISYKLGERAWLAARAEAMRRPGFRPEAVAHRGPEPRPDRPGRPDRRAGPALTCHEPLPLGLRSDDRWPRRAGRSPSRTRLHPGLLQVLTRSRSRSLSGERPATWYRPGGSRRKTSRECATPTSRAGGRDHGEVTLPGRPLAGCCSARARIGPPDEQLAGHVTRALALPCVGDHVPVLAGGPLVPGRPGAARVRERGGVGGHGLPDDDTVPDRDHGVDIAGLTAQQPEQGRVRPDRGEEPEVAGSRQAGRSALSRGR